jgi:predicted histone-like DNA-binding protein
MALRYNPIKRKNPQKEEYKWYAGPKLTGSRDLKQLSQDISELSSLSPGDVLNVIANLITMLPKWLKEGDSIKLDGFGSFRLSFSSDGVATKEEVTASLIKDIRILFDADDNLKRDIAKTKILP